MKEERRNRYPLDWRGIAERTIEERGSKCESCGQSRALGQQYQNPLTVHAIDGNPANTAPSNLVVLCVACDLSRKDRKRGARVGEPVAKEQLRLPLE